MDVKEAALDPKWDQERLGWLAEPLEDHGGKICKDVIGDICTKLARCKCVTNLAPYLFQKKLIGEVEFNQLQQPTATGSDLNRIMISTSHASEGRGRRLIRDLYLALLNAFAENCELDWCHNMALNLLRGTAIKYLTPLVQLPSDQIDKWSVVANIPDTTLESPRAAQLRHQLGLPSSGTEVTSLRRILEMYMATAPESPKPGDWLIPLVRGMMLTEGVGRYVAKLLPFHKSYPVELLIFLGRLGCHWEKFAFFLGFTGEEVDAINERCGALESYVVCFQRVWRIPDLKRKQNEEILYSTLLKADINLGVPGSPPPSLNVLFEINGERVGSAQIASPSLAHHGSWKKNEKRVAQSRHTFREQKSNSSGYGSMESQYSRVDSQQIPGDNDDAMSQLSLPQVRNESDTAEENDSVQHPSSPLTDSFQSLSQSPFQSPGNKYISHVQSSPSPSSIDTCSSQRPTSLHLAAMSPSADTGPSSSPGVRAPPSFKPDDEVTFPSNSSESLGMGLYGEVLVVEHNGQQYAAKEYSSRFITPDNLKTIFTQKILSLNHKNIVALLGVCCIKGTDRSVVVMERYPKSLEAVCDEGRVKLEPRRKLSILSDVADGLGYLHSHDLPHCDLVPSNVLLTVPDYAARISDFGNCLVEPIYNACIEGRQECSNLHDYLPPEAFEGDITNKVDVFSFGHLSLYIVLQKKPHPLKNPIYKVKGKSIPRTEVERREVYLDEMSTKVKDNLLEPLLEWTKMCLADEANERPEIATFHSTTHAM